MTSRIPLCIALALALQATAARAASPGDPEAGRRNTVACNGCHAQAGMQNVPNLGGQSPAYFVAAMHAYQDGKRKHATMRDVAKAWSDKELRNFAAWYAQFGAAEPAADSEAPPQAKACEACHGAQGRTPVNPDSPVLAGQKPAFVKMALREYRDGVREHAVMQTQAAGLSDADIEALAAYFSQQKALTIK